MTRGKYGTAAEARQVREGALSEVVAGRAHIVRLTKERDELKDTLRAERITNAAEIKQLKALLDEGTSPEVWALTTRLRESEANVRTAEHRVTERIFDSLRASVGNNPDARAAKPFYEALAKALGIGLGRLFDALCADTNRAQRRDTSFTRSDAAHQRLAGKGLVMPKNAN